MPRLLQANGTRRLSPQRRHWATKKPCSVSAGDERFELVPHEPRQRARALLQPLAERRPVLAHQGEGVAVLGGPRNVARLGVTVGHCAALLMRKPGRSRRAVFSRRCAARGSPGGPQVGQPTTSLATTSNASPRDSSSSQAASPRRPRRPRPETRTRRGRRSRQRAGRCRHPARQRGHGRQRERPASSGLASSKAPQPSGYRASIPRRPARSTARAVRAPPSRVTRRSPRSSTAASGARLRAAARRACRSPTSAHSSTPASASSS